MRVKAEVTGQNKEGTENHGNLLYFGLAAPKAP